MEAKNIMIRLDNFLKKEESKEFISNNLNENIADIVVDFVEIEKSFFINGKTLCKGIVSVKSTNIGLVYDIRIQSGLEPYAWFIPVGKNHYEVRYLKGSEKHIKYSQNLLEIVNIEQILNKKHSKVIGKFGCKGYDTFGPFKLVGGIAKGHPDEEDIKNAVEFVKGL